MPNPDWHPDSFTLFCYQQRQRLTGKFSMSLMRVDRAWRERQKQADLEWEIRGNIASCCGLPRRAPDSD